MNEKAKNIVGMTLFSLFIIGVLLSIYFLGLVGLFEIIGVEYQSLWSLVFFVISIFFLSIPLDLIMGALADLTAEKLSGKIKPFMTQFIFGFMTNWIIIYTVNVFMDRINFSTLALLIVPVVITLFELILGDDKNKFKNTAE